MVERHMSQFFCFSSRKKTKKNEGRQVHNLFEFFSMPPQECASVFLHFAHFFFLFSSSHLRFLFLGRGLCQIYVRKKKLTGSYWWSIIEAFLIDCSISKSSSIEEVDGLPHLSLIGEYVRAIAELETMPIAVWKMRILWEMAGKFRESRNCREIVKFWRFPIKQLCEITMNQMNDKFG